MKYFIITIDTEGDNLWEWHEGKEITTNNVDYLERFQLLANKYGFKPVWLSNWEMINDDKFVDFIKKYEGKKECELGMHLHAWNTPPYFELPKDKNSGNPYLIEYPIEIMGKKIATMNSKMKEKFGFVPITHRAGRWAINDEYYSLLHKYGYKIDCSITPSVNWESSVGQTPGFAGPDYRDESYRITRRGNIVEIPVTTQWSQKMIFSVKKSWQQNKKEFKHHKYGRTMWIRPNGKNIKEMLYLVGLREKSDIDYIMFMLHSSELMPGGSPSFKTEDSIDKLYKDIEKLFKRISKSYSGVGLEEYCKIKGLIS